MGLKISGLQKAFNINSLEMFFSHYFLLTFRITRTKTSIRYAKENDREKRERERKVEGDIEREGEIRERER